MAFRRSHKKSRAGCLECKRRHIKCDEGRPVCRLCTMAERAMYCSYSSAAKATPAANVTTHTNIPTLTTSSHEPTPTSTTIDVNMGGLEPPNHNLAPIRGAHQIPSPSTTGSINSTADSTMCNTPSSGPYENQPPFPAPSHGLTAPSLPGEALNMEHIELVVHLMRTKGMFNLGVNLGNYYKQMAIGFEYGLKAPYLTHQFLAYAARHLAHLHPDRYMYYTHQADTHQTRAIQLFNLAISPSSSSSPSPASYSESQTEPHNPINQSNCVAVFLFSSVLGQTLIAETFDPRLHPTFIHPNGNLDEFLKSYTQCLNTFRGVFLIGKSAWPLLINTPLAGYLLYGREFNQQVPRGHHCDLLIEFLNTTYKIGKMSQVEHEVCLQMARYLQVGFDSILSDDPPNPTIHTSNDPGNTTSIPIDPRLNVDPPSHPNTNHAHQNTTSNKPPRMTIAIAEPPSSSSPRNAELNMKISLSDLETDPTDPEMTHLNKSLNKYQMLSAFSMLSPAEFSTMLETKRPEALVILGYYALLLFYGRHMWQVGDSGRVILGLVDGYLGLDWRGWLRGPLGVVFGAGAGEGY